MSAPTHPAPRAGGNVRFYLVEAFDEAAFTLWIVALPLLRDELGLDYAGIGLLLGLPLIVSAVAEPLLLLLGDAGWRRRLIWAGGLVLAAGFLLTAAADSFAMLLAVMAASYPASGAFVSLTQAEMIERRPGRETHAMAGWTAAGTIGGVVGPAALSAILALSGSWRLALIGCAAAALALTVVVAPTVHHLPARPPVRPRAVAATVWSNLRPVVRRGNLWRWLTLLPLADLMLDVFFGYLTLYLTDVVFLPAGQAALAASLWLVGFLLGQLVLRRWLLRFNSGTVLRATAVAALLIYPVGLLAPLPLVPRLIWIFSLGWITAPWYPILKGQAYAAAPGLPSTVGALDSAVSSLGGILAAGIGGAASVLGLTPALLLLAVAPISLLLLAPRSGAASSPGIAPPPSA